MIKFTDFYNHISNPSNDSLYIIICDDSKQRAIIHQYLENNYPIIKKTSLRTTLFDAYIKAKLIRCFECDKFVLLSDYHYGMMENNKDEYRTGICSRCGEMSTWEPNYDDWEDIKCLYKNNMIVFGNYITFNRPNHAISENISKQQFDEIMTDKKIFKISAPTKLINKRKLQDYIDISLKNLI